MIRSKGVGFCENNNCDGFMKGVFLLNHNGIFYCPTCRTPGFIVEEERDEVQPNTMYTTVEVKFNYNPMARKYADRAIVSLEPKRGHNIYHYSSPLLKSEQRALKAAVALINAVNTHAMEPSIASEHIIDLDKPLDIIRDDLKKLESSLKEKERRIFDGTTD